MWRVGHRCGEEFGPFCWRKPAVGVAVFDASHQFAQHTFQIQWPSQNSESCSGSNWQQPAEQWASPFCWCKFGFGKCLGASSRSNHWSSCHWLWYKTHFSSHIWSRNGLLLLCRMREDNTSKWWLLGFSHQLTRHPLTSSFTFPICFNWQMTVEWSKVESSTTSRVVVRGSVLRMALSCSLTTSDGWPLSSPSSRLSSSQNFLRHHALYVPWLFLGQMCCWCCELSPLLYDQL